MEVTSGKQKRKTGDSGVRGKLVAQLAGVQCNRERKMVVKDELNRFKYEVIEEPDPVSGLTMPVVWKRAQDFPAQQDDDGAHLKDGKWVITRSREKLEPDYAKATDLATRYVRLMDHKIFLRCKVIWPETYYSEVLPLSVAIKGIEFPEGPSVGKINFITEVEKGGSISRFMSLCMAFGYQPAKLDPNDPAYDRNYLEPYVSDLELPYTEAMIVEKLLIPVLVRLGQQGYLVRCETSEKSHFIIGHTVAAMTESDAQAIWLEVQAKEEEAVEAEKEEEKNQPPFFGDEVVDDGGPEKMRARIRTMGASDPELAFKISEFLDSEGIVYDDESLLSSLDGDALTKVIKRFSPEKKPSL